MLKALGTIRAYHVRLPAAGPQASGPGPGSRHPNLTRHTFTHFDAEWRTKKRVAHWSSERRYAPTRLEKVGSQSVQCPYPSDFGPPARDIVIGESAESIGPRRNL
jgi:hypothetical protein